MSITRRRPGGNQRRSFSAKTMRGVIASEHRQAAARAAGHIDRYSTAAGVSERGLTKVDNLLDMKEAAKLEAAELIL